MEPPVRQIADSEIDKEALAERIEEEFDWDIGVHDILEAARESDDAKEQMRYIVQQDMFDASDDLIAYLLDSIGVQSHYYDSLDQEMQLCEYTALSGCIEAEGRTVTITIDGVSKTYDWLERSWHADDLTEFENLPTVVELRTEKEIYNCFADCGHQRRSARLVI